MKNNLVHADLHNILMVDMIRRAWEEAEALFLNRRELPRQADGQAYAEEATAAFSSPQDRPLEQDSFIA